MNIIPLIGFDDVKFGDSREQVLKVLGEPDEKHDVEFPDGASTESWSFDGLQVELNFDSDLDYRLVRITFYHQEVVLEDVSVIGKSESELQQLFPQIYLDDEMGDMGYSYEWLEKEISFWVTEGVVRNFTLFVPLDENGTRIMWPE